jgi:hypothetical protein
VGSVALIHNATLTPSKLDLLSDWLPSQSWYPSSPGALERLGAYRFDDPEGEVGLEAFVVRTSAGSIVHVPLTYRGAPLANAEPYLVGTTEHSVLGTRWVYDGCADPVWVSQLAAAILSGGTQVEELVDEGGRLVPREPTMTVKGSGTANADVTVPLSVQPADNGATTVIGFDGLELVVVRNVGTKIVGTDTLAGRWPDNGHAILAAVL